MKRIRNWFLAILTICVTNACESILKEEPLSLVVPTEFFNSEAEIRQALNGVYSYLGATILYRQQMSNLGDVVTDMAVSRDDLQLQYSYREHGPSDKDLVDDWSNLYAGINSANTAIRGIKTSPVRQELKDALLAEARFLRGIYYFILTNYWGDVPYWGEEMTSPNEVGKLPRTPVKEVYKHIIEDLTYAGEKLPASYSNSQKSRATRGSAQALLTRVYLFDKNWAKAVETAQKVISSGTYQLSPAYGDIFLEKNERSNKEIIFTTEFKTQVYGTSRIAQWTPRFDREGVADFAGFGSFVPSKLLIKSLIDSDLRKPQLIMTEWKGQKFKRTYWGTKFQDIGVASGQSGKDFIILRLAETYLSLAEAENELNGPTTVAFQALNEVRARAGLKGLVGLSKDQLRDAIIQERGIELVGEGLRRWDLNRWGILVKAVKTVDKGDNSWAAENVKEFHQLCRIPAAELLKNPNLTQNAGY